MTTETPKCPGNGCIVNDTPVYDDKAYPPTALSTNCAEAKVISTVAPSFFSWPDYSLDIARSWVDSGYEHLHKNYFPYMYFTGYAENQGRESVEAYFRPGPKHPTNPQPYVSAFPLGPLPTDLASLKDCPAPSNDTEPIREHKSLPTETSAGSIAALLHWGPFSQGPKDCVHGGAIATAADVLAYRTVSGCGLVCVTANLSVDYRRVIPIGQVVVFRANIEKIEGRKVTANFGIFSPDGTVLFSEGSGLFIRPKQWDTDPEAILSK